MIRLVNLILFLAIVLPTNTRWLPLTTRAAQVQSPTSAGTSSEEVPRYAIPQNVPCADQPKSHRELAASFAQGKAPLASQITGTWVEIGDVYKDPAVKNSLNCSGVREGRRVRVRAGRRGLLGRAARDWDVSPEGRHETGSQGG